MVTRKVQSDSKLAMSIHSEGLRREIIRILLCAYSEDNISSKILGLSLKMDDC